MHSDRSHSQGGPQQTFCIALAIADGLDGKQVRELLNVLDPQAIQRLAHLARLRVESSELQALSSDLSKIVALVDQLSQVPTDGVEPMVHAFEQHNVLAPDVVEPSLPREQVLRNAPSQDGECFLVPPVLG